MAEKDKDRWESLVAGEGCPLDSPRASSNEHWDLVAQLTVSTLYLAKNQTYRGQCQLIFDPRHVARLDRLSRQEWSSFGRTCSRRSSGDGAVRPGSRERRVARKCCAAPALAHHPRWSATSWGAHLADALDSMPDARLLTAEHALIATCGRRSPVP
jgi:hypothetical protein